MIGATWTVRVVASSVVAATCVVTACAPSNGARVRADLKSVERDTTSGTLSARGEGFAQLGDMTRAEQYLAAAMVAGGDPALLTRRLVSVCVADHRYPAALEYAERYLEKHPLDSDVRYVVGTLYYASEEPVKARSSLEWALRGAPSNADAHFLLATILRESPTGALEADRHFREYLRLAPAGTYAASASSLLLRAVR
ncbi:MAG: hypothetical protein NVS3B20_26770 [Polyangiales bacterium]